MSNADEAPSFDFSLRDLTVLTLTQVALVFFHPQALLHDRLRAEYEMARRRKESALLRVDLAHRFNPLLAILLSNRAAGHPVPQRTDVVQQLNEHFTEFYESVVKAMGWKEYSKRAEALGIVQLIPGVRGGTGPAIKLLVDSVLEVRHVGNTYMHPVLTWESPYSDEQQCQRLAELSHVQLLAFYTTVDKALKPLVAAELERRFGRIGRPPQAPPPGSAPKPSATAALLAQAIRPSPQSQLRLPTLTQTTSLTDLAPIRPHASAAPPTHPLSNATSAPPRALPAPSPNPPQSRPTPAPQAIAPIARQSSPVVPRPPLAARQPLTKALAEPASKASDLAPPSAFRQYDELTPLPRHLSHQLRSICMILPPSSEPIRHSDLAALLPASLVPDAAHPTTRDGIRKVMLGYARYEKAIAALKALEGKAGIEVETSAQWWSGAKEWEWRMVLMGSEWGRRVCELEFGLEEEEGSRKRGAEEGNAEEGTEKRTRVAS